MNSLLPSAKKENVIPIHISVVNKSTLFSDADLAKLANALQIQVSRDFLPIWGVNAKIFYTPTGKNPSADHWVLALLDDADMAGALGYHDVSATGLPLGKAFVRTTLADGGLVSVTVSHELVEMLGDPAINLTALDGALLRAYETADAVEADADGYEIVIPAGWPDAGAKVQVSNFVTPAWFEGFRTSGPFDFKNTLTKPFELRPGGYIGFLDLNNLSAGWQQQLARTATPQMRIQARPNPGSRRSRRALARDQWVVSTYGPDNEAVAAKIL